MSTTVKNAITQFAKKYSQQILKDTGQLPKAEYDPEWLSPCIVDEPIDERVSWQAVNRAEDIDLTNIEEALDIKLHPSISEYYCSQYSYAMPAIFEGNWLELLQAWNDDDYNLLQQNLISHIMMKRKLKQQITLFLAVTDDDTLLISLLNETGQVVLEPVGKEPTQVLAESLAEFIEALTPAV